MKTFITKKKELLIVLSIVLLTFIIYWPVMRHNFVFDDDLYIVDNPHVLNGLSLRSILWSFTSLHAANWHPLTWLSHLLDVSIFGVNPRGHHYTNLLLHILNAVLLFTVFKNLTGNFFKSTFIAILFALHPLHVESVAWIAERKNLLFAFFWILTMQSYLSYSKNPHIKRYIPIIFWYMLSLMSKPMAVTLPCVLLLMDYWPLNRYSCKRSDWYKNAILHTLSAFRLVLEKLPLFILCAGVCVITFIAQRDEGAVMSISSLPLETRLANALVAYMIYIKKMLWPDNQLAVFYPHPGQPPTIHLLGACILFGLIFFLCIKERKRRPYLIVGWLWYLGTLIPVIGIIQVGSQSIADRYTYIPLIGLFIMIGWGAPNLFEQYGLKKKWSSSILAFVLILTMWITSQQVNYWKDEVTLFRHAVDVTQNNELAHYNLGKALSEQGDYLEAIKHHREVLKLKPNNVNARNNLGIDLEKLGQFDKALIQYRKAIQLDPKNTVVLINMGNALIKKGRKNEAIKYYLKALELEPNNSKIHNNMGIAFLTQGDIHKAVRCFTEALRLNPDYADANRHLQIAIALLPQKL